MKTTTLARRLKLIIYGRIAERDCKELPELHANNCLLRSTLYQLEANRYNYFHLFSPGRRPHRQEPYYYVIRLGKSRAGSYSITDYTFLSLQVSLLPQAVTMNLSKPPLGSTLWSLLKAVFPSALSSAYKETHMTHSKAAAVFYNSGSCGDDQPATRPTFTSLIPLLSPIINTMNRKVFKR